MVTTTADRTAPGDLDLQQLNTEARRLWQTEPDADATRRPLLLEELADVELALERLSLRASQTELDSTDLANLDECRHRLSRLRSCWRPDA